MEYYSEKNIQPQLKTLEFQNKTPGKSFIAYFCNNLKSIDLTFKKAWVIHRSWVDMLIPHLIFIPAVEAHIFLPLFEPVTVHQVP